MSLTSKLKDTWKYIGLGVAGALSIFNTTKAQSTEYQKPTTEITQEGDNIIIPENKLNEFISNYKPEKTLNKITDITLEGVITDPLTTQPLEGIELNIQVYDGATLTGTYGPVFTNINGYYQFSGITDVKNEQTPNNQSIIKYIGNTIFTNDFNEKTFKIYDAATKEEIKNITTTDPTININLERIASGRYITVIKTKNWADMNIFVNDKEKIIGFNKKEGKPNTTNNKLSKTTNVGGVIDITDATNSHHRYNSGIGEFENNNPTRDFSLIPKISLEFPITDPEYTIIPTITTIRDLIWYTARVQGEWDNRTLMKTIYPIKLHIDTTNAPQGWKEEIRKVITFYQDSLEIHPDSLIKENPVYTEPAFNNGFSAINIIYTDSTTIGQQYSTIDMVISASNNAMIGGWIKINVPKITNTTDAGMVTARQIEKYVLQSYNRIKDPRYLGNTTYNNLGNTKRPNNDEKKLIKIGRYTKPYYINRVYP